MNDDGSRRWLRPRLSPGQFLASRRVVAYVLIAIFASLPLIRINGHPLILLDIVARRFHIFGASFYPTDTLPLALLIVALFLSIFWITALFGRVWCGWACPQTVYMEFLFRPIERLLEGAPGRARKPGTWLARFATPLKYAAYLLCSFCLAHIFLSYFVSWSNLRSWVFGSPFDHPIGFGVVVCVTGAMMFDFGYFREQVCLVACPYGRFQSVLLDRHSLIVSYDAKRGEPRGKKKTGVQPALPIDGAVVALTLDGGRIHAPSASPGDCVDCSMCVTTCPTGIDIRNGLQMECIGCAQCIDACDSVMQKLRRPLGLIRYSSQAAMDGAKFQFWRPRVLLYPCVIVAIAALFVLVLLNAGLADITLMRGLGQPFATLPDDGVRNNVRIKIVNRLDEAAEYSLGVAGLDGAILKCESSTVRVPAGEMITIPAEIDAPKAAFRNGQASVKILVKGPRGFEHSGSFTLLGPASDSKHEHEHEVDSDDKERKR